MLTTTLPAKSPVTAALTALLLATLPAAPALALGDKEKGFLAGVITAVILDELLDKKAPKAAPPAPPPVYVDPTPATPPFASTPAGRAFNSYSKDDRKAIQLRLRAWGYYHGPIDGSFDKGTYTAVRAFAADEGRANSLQTMGGAFALYDGLIY